MCGTVAPAHATYWTLLTSEDLMACSPLGAGMGTLHNEGRKCLGQEEGPCAGPSAQFLLLSEARSWTWGRTGSQAAAIRTWFSDHSPCNEQFRCAFLERSISGEREASPCHWIK